MKSTLRSTLLVPFALAAFTSSLHAATLAYSTTTPTVDGADISNFTGTTEEGGNVAGGFNDDITYIAGGRGTIGQTFTTGGNAGGYTLSAFSFQSVTYSTYGYTSDTGGITFTLRVGTIAASALTELSNETVAITGSEANQPANGFPATGNGNFVTFTLAEPVELAANTSYFFDMTLNAGANYFFQTNGTNTDPLAGGQAYHTVTGDKLGTTATLDAGDRVFHADIAAVPEPSSALLGVLGVLALVRRRRA